MRKPRGRGAGRTSWLLLVGLAALLSLGLILAGCGDDDDDSGGGDTAGATAAAGGGAEEAQAIVDQWVQPPTEFTFTGEPFDASAADGKKVWYISVNNSIPVLTLWSDTLTTAVEPYGVDVTVFDGKGQVAEFQRGMEQAIAANADVIALMSIDPALLSAQIQAAEAAGIPVVTTQSGRPAQPTIPGVVAEVSFDYEQVGKIIAAWAVADKGGPVNALVVSANLGVPSSPVETAGIVDEIARLAPESEVKVEDRDVTKWGAPLQSLASSSLNQDPELEYILPLYDGMTVSVLAGVAQANANDRARVASFNATPGIVDSLAKDTPLKADVGGANIWWAYGLADQLMRVLTGNEPVVESEIPLRLFTTENIGEVDLATIEETGYGTVDFVAEYERLWTGG